MRRSISIVAAVAAATLLLLPAPAVGEEPADGPERLSDSGKNEETVTLVRVDPDTGELESVAVSARHEALRRQLLDELSTSHEGLVPVVSPVAGGGVMVHLQGRFQNTMTVVRRPDGTLSFDCSPTPSEVSAGTDAEAAGAAPGKE